jgi:hypothetical protein
LSTDLIAGILPGVINPGLTIYFSDTHTWKIVVDGTGLLADYSLPVSVTATITGGDANAANQTAVQAVAGADASKAIAVQGITGGKAIPVTMSGGGDASAANQTAVQVAIASPTVAPTKDILVSGKSNDATAQYQPLPEGAGGRSIIVEGISGGVAQPITQSAATLPSATTMQNAVSQTATGTDLVTTGYATAIIQVVSSTPMSGGTNVQFWATPDGSTYYPILAHQIGVSANLVTSTTSDGEYRISCSGFQSIEARIAGYSAGTVTIKGYVSPIAAFPTTITGLVGGFSAAPPVNPVLSVAASYVTGDYVGTSSAPMEFTNIARTTGGTFYIPGATLIDIAKQSISGELWLFNSTVAPPLDSAAWTISSADMVKLLCVIPFSTYYATASYSVSQGHPDYVGPYKAVGTSVFGCFVTRGSPSYASLNLTFILGSAQD